MAGERATVSGGQRSKAAPPSFRQRRTWRSAGDGKQSLINISHLRGDKSAVRLAISETESERKFDSSGRACRNAPPPHPRVQVAGTTARRPREMPSPLPP
ncbi:hypothetical protein SKAU_G00299830 [Synaphobranchus kaupii]|uniref:Uncharacterized protein n=1 Tax=Synaphobranchus kaupii TaxID=118154 RepID=A0A9Q1IL12_SYNKA|nr:hypothetical protein SKAU_G00299830 [Synaphobranchus kaupii]